MKIAPLLPNEQSQLACLYRYDILDSEAEADIDEIVQLASQVCEAPISMISLIDDHRQWFKAKLGVEPRETARDPAFCTHALWQEEIMEVPDAMRDERFYDNPFVTGTPGIRFYAGMPLTMEDGSRLGTLCVIDRQPRQLTDEQRNCLRILGKQVVHLLELRLKVKELNATLKIVEAQRAELQKLNTAGHQLLSDIGHDLRGPLATLTSLLDLYRTKQVTTAELPELLGDLAPTAASAAELLDDPLAWTLEQFDGRPLKRDEVLLGTLVEQEIKSNRAAFERKWNTVVNEVPADFFLWADRHALGFLVRNLLLNANKFTENGTITVEAERRSEVVRISIADTGVGMKPEQLAQLFDPAARNSTPGTQGKKGSVLGLQLCQQFAEEHGGRRRWRACRGRGRGFRLRWSGSPRRWRRPGGISRKWRGVAKNR